MLTITLSDDEDKGDDDHSSSKSINGPDAKIVQTIASPFVSNNLRPIQKHDAIRKALDLERKLNARFQRAAVPLLAEYMDLTEIHRRIAEQYAIASEWESAAFNSVHAAKYCLSLHHDDVAAIYFEQAATYFTHAKLHEEAHEHLRKAILLHVNNGDLRIAGRLEKNLGFA